MSDPRVAAAAAKSLQSCPTVRPQRQQPTRLLHPWDSPGKNTGVGCHFLLQCMKVKSESEVAHSCPTLSDPMDCSLPGSSIRGTFQARVLEWVAIAFSEIQGLALLIFFFCHAEAVSSSGCCQCSFCRACGGFPHSSLLSPTYIVCRLLRLAVLTGGI